MAKQKDFDVDEQVEQLQTDFTKKLAPVKEEEKNIILWALKRIPLFTGLVQRIDKTGEKVVSAIDKIDKIKGFSQAFHITGIVFAALDFIRVPIVVLGGLVQGKRLSFSFPKTAKWVYSGIVLALTAVSLAVPFAAPFIAVALASIALVASVISMGNLFYARYRLKKDLPKLKQESDVLLSVRNALLLQVSRIQRSFSNLTEEEKDNQRAHVKAQLHAIHEKLEINQEKRQECLNNITQKTQKLGALASPGEVVKKIIPIILGVTVLVGAALSLVFPPVGVIILATAACAGFLYSVASMIASYVISKRNAKKIVSTDEISLENMESKKHNENDLSIKDENIENLTWDDHPLQGVTESDILHGLHASPGLNRKPPEKIANDNSLLNILKYASHSTKTGHNMNHQRLEKDEEDESEGEGNKPNN